MAMSENGSGKLRSVGVSWHVGTFREYYDLLRIQPFWIDEASSYPLGELADLAPAAAHPVGDGSDTGMDVTQNYMRRADELVRIDEATGFPVTCSSPGPLIFRASADVAPVAFGSEIPVTPEMDAAGYEAIKDEFCLGYEFIWLDGSRLPMGGIDDFRGLFSVIFRAMAAVAPFELVSRGEMAELRERDEALAQILKESPELVNRIGDLLAVRERDELRAEIATGDVIGNNMAAEMRGLRAQLGARDANIADLKSQLAARPAPVPDTPKATPDFTRDFSGDRRRVGG